LAEAGGNRRHDSVPLRDARSTPQPQDHKLTGKGNRTGLAGSDGLSGQLSDNSAAAQLHVYTTANGLPELRATREPANGRVYVGAFPPLDAIAEAERITRAALGASA
jgi:hypothetical protein